MSDQILSVITQDKQVRPQSSRRLGDLGEQMAADHLTRNGFRLVAANFMVPVGRNSKGVQVSGEIDLIALENDTLCFIEVKTRRSAEFAGPLSAVDRRKQRQITRTARVYRKVFGLKEIAFRFDVITVLLEKGEDPQIELIRGFWSEAKFRKKAWIGDI
ncbi:MAG: YraN family protein [Pyrinomonadaceae bacterium]